MFFSKSEYLSARAIVTVPPVSCQLWCPKVSKGERREAGIQWIQPPKAVSDPEFRQTTSGAHGSANRADCLPRGKPFGAPAGARLFPCRGTDAPTPAREQSLQPYGAFTLFFRWRKKSVQKKASGTATTEAARPAVRNSQISAFRALPCPALVFAQACQSLTAFGSCAHWAHAPSRPKLRSAVAPSGLSSSTGCPVSHSSLPVALLASHPPCGSLWAAPKAPLGPRFPSGQFASLTLLGKKPFIAHFDGGARYVARSGVGQLTPTVVRARSSPFSAVKMGGPFSLRCLSPLCSPAVGVGHTQPLQGFRFRRSGWRSDLPLAGGFRNAIGQAAGSRTRPASREACRRAAVASRSSCMSPERPARPRRAVRG